jgi:hypothetical protein
MSRYNIILLIIFALMILGLGGMMAHSPAMVITAFILLAIAFPFYAREKMKSYREFPGKMKDAWKKLARPRKD